MSAGAVARTVAVAVGVAAATSAATTGGATPTTFRDLGRLERKLEAMIEGSYGPGRAAIEAQLIRANVPGCVKETIQKTLIFYNRQRGDAHPAVATVAKLRERTDRTIRRHYAIARDAGLMTSLERWQWTSRYDQATGQPLPIAGDNPGERTSIRRFPVYQRPASTASMPDGEWFTVADEDDAAALAFSRMRERLELDRERGEMVAAADELELLERAATSSSSSSTRPTPASPSSSSSEDLGALFVDVAREEHARQYGHGEDAGSVGQENRERLAGALLELTATAAAWCAERGLEEDRPAIARELARWMAHRWLELPGSRGFLRQMGHKLGFLAGDVGKLAGDALEAFKLSRRRRPSSPPPAPAAPSSSRTSTPTIEPVPVPALPRDVLRELSARALAACNPSATATPRPSSSSSSSGEAPLAVVSSRLVPSTSPAPHGEVDDDAGDGPPK